MTNKKAAAALAPETRVPFEWPGEGVASVPYRVYQDPDLYAREQERIFHGPVWNFLCLELEVPNPGDYRTTAVGETPIVVTRDQDAVLHALVNRCTHKGALVCFRKEGNGKVLTCAYHNWSYDLQGNLMGVPFRKGINDEGGMPEGFDPGKLGLRKLRVETFCGLVFGTFSNEVEPLQDFLGAAMSANIKRLLGKPIRLLGTQSQYLHHNWKLYIENVRDSYHATLLHSFFATFKLNRLSMEGGILMDEQGRHHISFSKMRTDQESDEYTSEKLRGVKDNFGLAEPGLLERWEEFEDGTTLAIQAIFPNFVVQQVHNSLAIRLLVPRGLNGCELFWWMYGFEDDDATQAHIRLKQSNLIGPGGYVSMEDGCIGGFVQEALRDGSDGATFLEMGGKDVAPSKSGRATESAVRGFWKHYRELMGV